MTLRSLPEFSGRHSSRYSGAGSWLEEPGTSRSDGPSQLLMMYQPATVSRPSGQPKERSVRAAAMATVVRPGRIRRDECREPGRPRHEEETLRRLLVRTDGLLIDSFDLSDRIRGSASREEDRDRAEAVRSRQRGRCGGASYFATPQPQAAAHAKSSPKTGA